MKIVEYLETTTSAGGPERISTALSTRDSRKIGEYFGASCNNKSNRE